MFTGIIQTTGRIASAKTAAGNTRVVIVAKDFDMSDVAIGDSIAVNGACLTVVEKSNDGFSADVSQETLDCTAGFERGRDVNLEKSLRFGDRVHGHLLSGHVDGVGMVTTVEDLDASWKIIIEAPEAIGRCIARKGSIAINGVSLTVNQVENNRSSSVFEINVIPHTHQVTTLRELKAGTKVNLEIDLVARYVERILASVNERISK